jgi:programmed cell death protein 4
VDDLALDVPDAAADLAMFVSRATVDDILPPKFVHKNLEGLLPGLRQGEKAAECIDLAHGHLSDGHCAERVLRAWGDPEKSPIDAAKRAIQDCLREYLASGDVAEARRCLRALNARYFHHELVKRALVLCIEAKVGAETAPRLLGLLKVLGDEGEVSANQMAIGFGRMDDVVADLKLDVPNAEERMTGLRLMAKEEGIFL